jgi:hypothetical protein
MAKDEVDELLFSTGPKSHKKLPKKKKKEEQMKKDSNAQKSFKSILSKYRNSGLQSQEKDNKKKKKVKKATKTQGIRLNMGGGGGINANTTNQDLLMVME